MSTVDVMVLLMGLLFSCSALMINFMALSSTNCILSFSGSLTKVVKAVFHSELNQQRVSCVLMKPINQLEDD